MEAELVVVVDRCVALQRQVLIASKVRSQISFQSFNAFISFQPYVECILHVKILPGNQPLDLAALIPIALDDPLYATCNDPQCVACWGGSPLLVDFILPWEKFHLEHCETWK